MTKKNKYISSLSKISFFGILLVFGLKIFGSDNLWSLDVTNINPQVSFTSSPADEDNDSQITICEGTTVVFTDTSTDVSENSIYEWTFEGGQPENSNGIGPHEVSYELEGNYLVELDIDGFTFSMTVNVISSDIEPSLDSSTWGSSTVNNETYFTYCGNQTSGDDFLAALFPFDTNSLNTTPNSIHSIYVDGVLFYTFTGENQSNLEYFAPVGTTQIIYTIQDGPCVIEKIFNLYVGANPTATISNEGVPVLCTPGSVNYSISYGAQNGPGTVYTINVSDGSAPVVFDHPPPSTYTHNFNSTSCGAEQISFSGQIYDNAYEISITATNACDQSTSGFAPIYIESRPEADFIFDPELEDDVICQGTPLNVIDSTIPGANIIDGNCDDSYKRFWQITAPDGTILGSTSNGALSPNLYATVTGHMGYVIGGIDLNTLSVSNWSGMAASQIEIQFLQPGDYDITLFTGGSGQSNQCGISFHTQTICVTPEVIADFNLSTDITCGPAIVTTENNSSDVGCENQNNYEWTVTYQNPENCPVSTDPNWEFINGTNFESFEPEFQFNTPGIYEISLTVSLGVNVLGTACDPATMLKTIVIKDTPQSELPSVELCQNEDYTFDLPLNDCYSDQSATFVWDFQGASGINIDNTNILNPTISFASIGNYPYTLTLSNECGDNVLSGSIVVSQQVDVSASGPDAVCLNSDIELNGLISGGVTTGSWTSSIAGGSFAPSANDLNTIYSPPSDFVGNIIFTLTSDDPPGPCPEVSDSISVEIQLEATVDAGVYDPFCINSPIQLAGSIGGSATSSTWSADVSGTFSNENDLNAIFNPESDFTGIINFTLTTNDPDGVCEAVSDVVEVIVIPLGQVNPISDFTYCHNDLTQEITFNTNEPGTDYSWFNDNISIGLGNQGQGNILPFTAFNDGGPPQVANITVVPSFTVGNTTCEGPSQSFQVIVNPGPAIDSQPLASQAVCLDGTPEVLEVTYVDGVGLPTYQWYVSDTCNTDPSTATLITGAESSSYAPPSDVEGAQYYFVELTFPEGGCGSVVSDCAEVEVVPDPVVSITSSLPTAICEGGSINDITVSYTGGVGTPSYQWYDNNGLIAGATSSSYNPGILTVAGSYDYYVELSFLDNPNNGCDLATSDTVTVTVVTDPTLTDLLTTQTVCQNSPSTPLEVTASGGTGVYSYQWYNDDGLIVGATLDSFTPPTDVAGTFNYYIVVTTDASGCEVTSTTSEVIVNPGPAIDSQPLASQAVCLDGTPEVLEVTYVDGVGLPTYQWYVSDTCNTDPSTATLITGAESSSYAPPSDVEGAQYYFVELTFPEGGCGSVVSDCAEVEVVPDPVVSITSSLPTAICEGGSINDITVSYTGGVGTPSYQWYDNNGLIAGATSSSYNPGILTVAGSYDYYVELSFLDNPNNGCDLATSDTVTVTVVTDPTLTDLLTTQTVCQNSPSTPLEVTASGGTGVYSYQWYNDDGLIVGATLDSFTPPTDVAGTFNYYIVVTTDASGCEVTSTTSEVIVNPGPAIDSQPLASQAVCLDGTPEVLEVTYVDGVGLPTYQWYVSDTCNTDPSTATLITGAESSSYAPPSDVEGAQYYFVELTFPEGGCGSVVSDCAEVEVVPDPVVSITSSLPTAICEGGSINDITVSYTGGVGTPSYQWYDNNGLIAGATSSSYNPGILTVAGSYDYYVELSFLDNPNNGCDLATSDTVTVTVVTDPTLTDLLTTQTVCQNSPSTPLEVTASGGTGVYSYQWYNDDGLIVGATLDSFTPPTDVAGTFNYYIVVTTDASGCEVTSTTSEVIVNPGPAIDSQPLASQAVCLDGTPEVLEVTYVDGVGLPTYQWYVSDTCNTDPSTATLITGAESSSYAPPSDVEGAQYYFVELTFPEGGCGSVVSDCAEVEVVPDPVVSITSSLPTAICEGGSINDITVSYTGGVGTPSYQWYDNNGLIAGATSSSYNPGILTVAGSYDYYVELSFLDNPNNGCDLATSDTVTVTVVTDPTLTDLLTTQTVCQNSPSTPLEVTASGGTGVYSYQWYNDDGLIVGATLDSFTPPTDVAGTFNYYIVVTTDASGCEVTSTTSEVIVNPGPAIDSQPLASQAVCLDGTPEVLEVTYVDGVGLPTYQWYVSDTCNTDPSTATLITGAESSSYAPPSDVEGAQYYFVELTFPEGGCGSVVSDCAEVEVVPDPVVSITSSLPTAICEGGSINDITVSYTGGVGTPSYQWYDNNGLIAGATSSSYNPGILTVAGSYDYYVELSFLDNPNNGCDLATSDTVTVTVVTDPTLTDLLTTQTVCQNSPSTPLEVTASGGTGVYSYQWYNDDGLIVGATLDSFTPPTDVAGTFNYYIVVTTDASGCEVTSTTSEVIVNPDPNIETQPLILQEVCQFESTIPLEVTYVDGVGLPTYQWYVSDTCNTDPSTATLITGAESSSYAPPSDVEGAQYYFVELTFPEGGCGSVVSDCAEVEVKPVAIISDVIAEICDDSSYDFSPVDGTFPDSNTIIPDQTTYSWDIFSISGWDGIGGPPITGGQVGLQEDNLIAFDSGTLENNTTELQIAVFEVTPWTNGCSGTSFNVEVTVSPSPEMNAVITNIECSYSEPLCAGSIEINPVGMLPFTYSWVGIGLPPLSNPTSKDQFDLCPGIYELTITDSSSCSYVYEYEIAPPEPVGFDLISLTDISCNNVNSGTCDGSIIVETSGGELPFNLIEWYTESVPDSGIFDLGPLTNVDNPFELINACEGNYILKILDSNLCEFISPVYNIENSADSITLDEIISNYNGYNISCFGANDGSLTIDLIGGSGNFEYNFVDSEDITIESGSLIGTNNTLIFDFLVSDEYTLYISDSNCDNEIVRNYNLIQPEELVVSAELVEPASCFGGLATYNVIASGGIPPYTGTGLQEVLPGSVTFIVSDVNGCLDDFSTFVSEPDDLSATFSVVDAPCFGDLGSISIIPSGGSGLITVSLFDEDDSLLPPTLNTTDGVEVIFDQPAGTYFFEIEDENDCVYGPISVTIDHPDPILVDLEIIQPDCNTIPSWEFNNGSICVTITGGTNPFPLGSDWVNSGAGQWCLLNLSEGTYPINITDDNGCSPIDLIPDVNLIRPPEITVSFNNTLTIDCDTDTATQTNFIFVNGGVPPYVITWSGGNSDPSTPNEMETTEPGNYSAFVNDQFGILNGCPPIEFPLDPITFFEFGESDFTIDSINNDFCEVFAISDPVEFANISTGDIVNFIWNFGDGSPQITNVDNPIHVYDVAGTYTIDLTVEDLYGCFDTYSQTIEITKGYEIILPNAFTPNGDGINETIRPVYNCMTEIKMSIYDTWGSLIYVENSNGDLYGWDGTIDGNIAENGNYIMVVEAVTFNGVSIDLNGPVTLIR